MSHQRVAIGAKAHVAHLSLEQNDTELLLKLADGMAHRAWGEMKFAGGILEGSGSCRRLECAQKGKRSHHGMSE